MYEDIVIVSATRQFLSSLDLPPSHNGQHMLKVQHLAMQIFFQEAGNRYRHLRTENAILAGTHDCSDPKVDADGTKNKLHREFLKKWSRIDPEIALRIIKLSSFSGETRLRENLLLRAKGENIHEGSVEDRKLLLSKCDISFRDVVEYRINWPRYFCVHIGCSYFEAEDYAFLRQILSEADKLESFDLYRCLMYGIEYAEKHSRSTRVTDLLMHVFSHCEEKLFYLYPYYYETATGRDMAYTAAGKMLEQYETLLGILRRTADEDDNVLRRELDDLMKDVHK